MCPICKNDNTHVTDTRKYSGYIRRRYECLTCRQRFTTRERIRKESKNDQS